MAPGVRQQIGCFGHTGELVRCRSSIHSFSSAEAVVRKLSVLIFLFALGCSSGTTNTTGVDPSSGAKSYRIAVIPKGTAHEFWKSVHAGAAKAAKERNADAIWKGPQIENDTAGQIAVVKNFITKGVDGIVLAPNHSESLVDVVNESMESGIPVVIFDSGLAEGADYLSYVATDNFHGGQLGAKQLAEAIGEEGDVILMRYRAGSESTEQREEGFLDEIRKYPNINVLSSDQYGEATTQSAMAKAQQLLLKYGEQLDGIFAVNESNCNGMLEALENSGLAGKVKFVAFDPSEKLITGLENETVHGIVLQDPVSMGYKAVQTLIDHIEGKEIPKRIGTGEYVATPANLHEAESQRLLKPEMVD
jgi:ribose transport system substrate-binding protein